MRRLINLLVFLLVLCFVAGVQAQTKFKYVGVKKCKMCHKGKKKGEIYEKWQASKHAKAFETLATDAAKKIAAEKGIKGDPQQAAECLACHVTGYDKEAAATLTKEEGVSCEACHGPGSKYKSMKVMKGITAGTMKGADYGLIEPDEKNCTSCHNPKSPTYKEFKFAEMYKQVEHHVAK